LRRIEPPAGLKLDWSRRNDMLSADAPGRVDSSGTVPTSLRERYAGVTTAAALEQLSAAVRQSSDDDSAISESITHLTELITAFPERAGELAVLLKNPGLPDAVRAQAMHALELAARETPAAQTALANILRQTESYSPEALSQAIVAAGGVKTIRDSGLEEVLSNIASTHPDPFLSDAATFALGRLARTNEGIRSRITPGLSAILANPSSSAEDIKMAFWTLRNGQITSEDLRNQAAAWKNNADLGIREAAGSYLNLYGASGH
jgi:hypothetical protein